VRVIERTGRQAGYLHFWYIHLTGVPDLLRDTLAGRFRDCDAIVIDLRGRGGAYTEIVKILDVIRADRERTRRPFVALVDRQSRSGKDILAYEFKTQRLATLVGEPSAGAVIPATFADVGHDTILMFPTRELPRYTELLEFKPVEPDVRVERAGVYAAGDDPILEAGVAEALRRVAARPTADPPGPARPSVDLLEEPLPPGAREEVRRHRQQPPESRADARAGVVLGR
jgi:carboxyl-terminal processing protease